MGPATASGSDKAQDGRPTSGLSCRLPQWGMMLAVPGHRRAGIKLGCCRDRGTMGADLEAWRGLVHDRVDPTDALVVEQPLASSPSGGSGTFLAVASDRRRWWVKPQNNLQGPRVIVAERIVGRMGTLLGAPVCEVAVVIIPEELAGWEFRPGAKLEPGVAHASLAINDAQELRQLEYRDRDDNRRRHAGVFALYDWCWGADDQWLHCESDDRKLYSHDHGMYLPDGPAWTEATLLARVDEPHPVGYTARGIDADALSAFAGRLETIGREEIAEVMSSVPASWPASDGELETLGFFLERRAPAVAARLRALNGGTP
jgi:hypothetical protein